MMLDFGNFLGQMSASNNPMAMALGMLPNNELKRSFSSLMNCGSDEERAQKLADWCNQRGITKEQLQQMLSSNKRF